MEKIDKKGKYVELIKKLTAGEIEVPKEKKDDSEIIGK